MVMPTYLLAFLVSPYHLDNKGTSRGGVDVRIIGRRGWEDQSGFALAEAMSIVDGMSEKFDLDYCDAFQGEHKILKKKINFSL